MVGRFRVTWSLIYRVPGSANDSTTLYNQISSFPFYCKQTTSKNTYSKFVSRLSLGPNQINQIEMTPVQIQFRVHV